MTSDRSSGIPRALDLLGINPVKDKPVLLKPNFNTVDSYPGSTHNDTLTAIVTTCCLKTHGYGATFTLSLKLAVGLTHKKNMRELHASAFSMKKMIAEINLAYHPAIILLDGIEAFVDKGPMTGTRKRADVLLAGTDRIAIDAVGLAVLKNLGSNNAIMDTGIFKQEQIARAVVLGLGISGPGEIELITHDVASETLARKLQDILMAG